MVDRRHVPEPLFEFVILADTHYVLPLDDGPLDMETRRFQTPRIARALELVRALNPDVVVHLGDLVQEYPGTPDFPEAMRRAREQLGASGLAFHHVAGNHDVGDKPDPTTAAPWVSPEFLADYESMLGRSWHSFDEHGLHFVVLNTMIMNSALPEAAEQMAWLRADLAEHRGERTVVCLHITPYLDSPDEDGLGHYDNIAEPARSELLALFAEHGVEIAFAGHSHFTFYDTSAGFRLLVAPSTSTTRTGFGEVFSSAPAPAHGHNDADKLGFFLARVYRDDIRINTIRLHGPAASPGPDMLITGTSRDLPSSRLGVTLRHPLTQFAEVPLTFPCAVRQPMRNDYPLLALVELGPRCVRVPARDLTDARLGPRHEVLHGEGVRATATVLWQDGVSIPAGIPADVVEIQLAGAVLPTDECLEAVAGIQDAGVSLCAVIRDERRGNALHPRLRVGYRPDELPALDEHLARRGARVDRAAVRIRTSDDGRAVAQAAGSLRRIGGIDLLVEVAGGGSAMDGALACEALAISATLPDARVFADPLVELDRTMDVQPGLLDRLCNPTPPFRMLQVLNTVLFGRGAAWSLSAWRRRPGGTEIELASEVEQCVLFLPGPSDAAADDAHSGGEPANGPGTVYELLTGRATATRARPHAPAAPCVWLTTRAADGG